MEAQINSKTIKFDPKEIQILSNKNNTIFSLITGVRFLQWQLIHRNCKYIYVCTHT